MHANFVVYAQHSISTISRDLCENSLYRYDLDNIVIESQDIYEDHLQGGTSYAPKGQFFVKLSLEEDLFEGTRSIRLVLCTLLYALVIKCTMPVSAFYAYSKYV